MVVIDHINLQGDNPLRGVTDSGLGDRFPDMSSPYDETLIKMSIKAAKESNIELHRGVYAAVNGTSCWKPGPRPGCSSCWELMLSE